MNVKQSEVKYLTHIGAMVAALEQQGWQFHNFIYKGEWVAFKNLQQAQRFVNSGSACWFIFVRGEEIHQIGTVYFNEGKYTGADMVGKWEQRVRNSIFERTVKATLPATNRAVVGA